MSVIKQYNTETSQWETIVVGKQGPQGESGFSGEAGATGAGTSGFSGQIGESGFSGQTGISGFSGQDGIIGTDGATGATGFSGFSGQAGASGFSGQAGESGFSGLGTSGFSGFSGSSSVVTISDSAPVSPIPGELWWDSDTGNSYIRYDDCTSNQWVLFSTVATENPPPVYENTIWSWGNTNYGRLGDNTGAPFSGKSSPVSVVGGFTDWCQVATASVGSHSLAVRTSGTAWAWGSGSAGRLGDNTTVNKSSPVSVVGGFCDWSQVSAGSFHSLGLRTNGTAWGWGGNYQGRLGNNSTVTTSSPVSVVGGFCDWCQISAGADHSLAIRTSGSLWAWGNAACGQLGDNTTVSKSSPVSVIGSFTDWCQVSGGRNNSLAVRQNGTAWGWGRNDYGQLGANDTVVRSSPVSVVGGFTDWAQISAGGLHSLGVRTNGTAWAWGGNINGQLGDDTVVNKSSPVSVVGGFTDWCQVSGGYVHSLAVRTSGTAWAWGQNGYGRLGDNCTTTRRSPVSVAGGFTDWCQVAGGQNSSHGLRSTEV